MHIVLIRFKKTDIFSMAVQYLSDMSMDNAVIMEKINICLVSISLVVNLV